MPESSNHAAIYLIVVPSYVLCVHVAYVGPCPSYSPPLVLQFFLLVNSCFYVMVKEWFLCTLTFYILSCIRPSQQFQSQPFLAIYLVSACFSIFATEVYSALEIDDMYLLSPHNTGPITATILKVS